MRIECRIPVVVRVTGELTHAQLAALGEVVARSVAARLKKAEQVVADRHRAEVVVAPPVRERYDPSRDTGDGILVPSYGDDGRPVEVAKKRKPPRKQDPAVKQRNKELRELREQAAKDPEAAHTLRERYSKELSAKQLADRARKGDQTAQAVLRHKFPSNEKALAKAVESDRPPHHADVYIVRGGVLIHREHIVSGNSAPEERALPFPQRRDATHTEARAVRYPDLRRGDVMTIMGQYDPCTPCQQAMQGAANRTGATIHYYWMGGGRTPMTFSPQNTTPPPVSQVPPVPPAPQSSTPPSVARRAVAGAAGAIAAANEFLSYINLARNQAKRNIELGYAEIEFWKRAGANPVTAVWDLWSKAPLPPGSTPRLTTVGSPQWPYVVDIDVGALRANLPRLIQSYQDFLHFMDAARTLDTIETDPPVPDEPDAVQRMVAERVRYRATVSKDDRAKRRHYDLTDLLAPIRAATLARLDATMRAEARALTAAQRHQVFRLRYRAATRIYRAAHMGGWNPRQESQPIITSQRLFGPDPWVRVVSADHDVRKNLSSATRVRVTPANADAERAALVSGYWVGKKIEDVLDEVKAGGRPILQRQPERGRLDSFVAGPMPGDTRFGVTRYHRDPDDWQRRTAAIGELNEFWVDRDDLEPVPETEIERYIR